MFIIGYYWKPKKTSILWSNKSAEDTITKGNASNNRTQKGFYHPARHIILCFAAPSAFALSLHNCIIFQYHIYIHLNFLVLFLAFFLFLPGINDCPCSPCLPLQARLHLSQRILSIIYLSGPVFQDFS